MEVSQGGAQLAKVGYLTGVYGDQSYSWVGQTIKSNLQGGTTL
jgi:hypothetical protein